MRIFAAIAFFLFAFTSARADQLIVNGGFESGLSSWTATSDGPGDGGFTANSGLTTPLTYNLTAGPHSGTYYAVSDDNSPQTQYLTQTFVTPGSFQSATLSFAIFVNDVDGAIFGPSGSGGMVTLLNSSGSLIKTLYGPADTLEDPGNPNPYVLFSQDIASYLTASTTYQLQFSSSDSSALINVGVDDVSLITANAVTSVTPEPSTLTLFATGGAFLFRFARRKSMAVKA